MSRAVSEAAIGSLTIAPGDWRLGESRRDEQRRFREQLGLPVDRPVVMTGHQAGFWHAGILAKYAAADAAARHVGAAAAWLVVDQDDNDPLEIRCPVVRDEVLGVETVRLGEGAGPTGLRAPVVGADAPDLAYATPSVERGMERMCAALRAHEDAASLAVQTATGCADVLGELGLCGSMVFATRMAATDAFTQIVQSMRDDPSAWAGAYNEAVSEHDGLRPLQVGERVELPLWVMDRGMRRPAFADDLGGELAPRALLMTGLMRAFGCDLFIHGTGGGGEEGYDAAGEAWLAPRLGALAPAVVASATMTLEAPGGDAPSDAEAATAKARAHKARHDPSIVGDGEAARAKGELLERIAAAKSAGENPAALFAEMQQLLEAYRSRHEATFASLDQAAAHLERRLGEGPLRADRTWAFPFHDEHRLRALIGQVEGAVTERMR